MFSVASRRKTGTKCQKLSGAMREATGGTIQRWNRSALICKPRLDHHSGEVKHQWNSPMVPRSDGEDLATKGKAPHLSSLHT